MTDRPKLSLTLSGSRPGSADRRPLIAPKRAEAAAQRHASADAQLRAALAALEEASPA